MGPKRYKKPTSDAMQVETVRVHHFDMTRIAPFFQPLEVNSDLLTQYTFLLSRAIAVGWFCPARHYPRDYYPRTWTNA